MSHWLRLSVKTDNLRVQHLYPRLPNAGDRIYIKCTYQTPLSHLWLHWWSPNLPKPASSSLTTSKHHMMFFFDRNARADEKKVQKKSPLHTSLPHWDLFFFFFCDLPLCVTSIRMYFCTFLLWIPPLFFFSVTSRFPPCPGSSLIMACSTQAEGLLSLSLSSLSLFSPHFPAKTIGRQDNPLL